MVIRIDKNKIDYYLLMLLCAFMPLHYYICELFLKGTSIDNLFRDFIIIILLIRNISRSGKSTLRGTLMTLTIALMICYAVISLIFNKYVGTLNILRTYMVPMLIYFSVRNISFSDRQIINLKRLIYIELALIGYYGFFQAFVLGDQFAIKLGYPQVGGFLATTSYYIGGFWGYQRVIGTFISPNVAGVIFAIALFTFLFRGSYDEKNKWLITGGLALGLIGTFSRSAMIGFILAVLLVIFAVGKIKINGTKILLWVVGIIFGIIIVMVVDSMILDNLFSRMLNSSFSGMLNMTDLSAQKHLTDMTEPIKEVMKSPFGLGFGNNGPMALSVNTKANVVESSFFLMAYEIGVIGAIIYFVPYFMVIINTFAKINRYTIPAGVMIICLFTYLLLPNVQTFEISFYAFLFMGFYDNDTIGDM